MFQVRSLERIDLIAFMGCVAILAIAGVIYPPYSSLAVIGVILGGTLLIARPDLAFAFFFAAETLVSEDILLVTEKLEITLYRIPLPYIGLNIFEAVMLMLVSATILQRKGVFFGTRLDFSLCVFGIVSLVGYVTCIKLSGDPTRLFEPRRILHTFIAYFLTVNLIRSKKTIETFLWIFFAAIVCKSLEGVFLYSMGAGLQIKWRIRAIFTGWGDSLCFVTYLLILAVFVVEKVKFPAKRLFVLCTPFVFFCFLFSYKRAYYIALMMGIFTIFWLQGNRARFRLTLLVILSICVIVGILTVANQWEAIGMRIGSILHPTQESSANYRLVEWHNALICIKNNPLTGIGLGGVMPMEIYLSRTNLLGVHNTFLWVAVKMGFFGLLSYLLLHFAFLKRLVRQNAVIQDPFLRTLSRGITCAFIAFSTAEMFAPMFSQMRTATWLGIMMGLGMMLGQIDRETNSRLDPNG